MADKQRSINTQDGRECNKVRNISTSLTDKEKAVILESIPGPIILIDIDLNMVWSNAHANEAYNLNAGQLKGRHCFEKIHGHKEPCSFCPAKKVFDSGKPCTVNDISFLGRKWMLHAYPLRDSDNNITSVVEIATDITASNKYEETLDDIQKLQSKILENSTVGIAFIKNRTYEWVNSKLCELYGIPKDKFIGLSTRVSYPDEESYQRVGNEAYSLLAEGKKAAFETLRRKADGSLFWCRLEGVALDKSKPNEGSIWIAEDITKRKEAEEELRKLTKLQSIILDNSSVGIALVRNRTYEWVNRKMSDLLGLPIERIQGSSTRVAYPSDEVYHWVGAETYDRFAQGKTVSLETPVLKGDGSLIWCRLEGIVLDPLNPQNGSIWISEDITKRKRAEEALRKSEEKFRSLIEGLNEALFRMTLPDCKFEYFSPSVANVLGYSAQEFIAHPDLIKQAIHPEFQDFINEKLNELQKGKVTPNLEYKIIDSEGKERWIIQSNKGIFDENGNLIAMEGLCRDISSRKQAEEALRENEEKFRSIYEESPIGIELYDQDGRLLDANRACLDLFGINDVNAVKGFTLFHDPNLSDEFKEQLKKGQSVRYEAPFDFEKVNGLNLYETNKCGIIYLDLLITPLKGASKDSTIGYLAHVRDITLRKQAERTLLESEKKYRRLHESMTEAFVSVDMKGRIKESNRAYQSMLGYTEEELSQLNYIDITPEKWHAFEEKIVKEQILIHGYSKVYEKEYRRKDGSIFPAELSAFLIRDDSANPAGMWGIVRDITERKQMEKTLKAIKDYLRTVFNNVYDAIFVHDYNGQIIDVNDKMLEMYEVNREEAFKFNVIRDYSVTDETIEMSRANWDKVMAGEKFFVQWKAKRPKDGSVFDVEVFLTKLVLPDGNYILANVRDITMRKKMEEEQSKMVARMHEIQKLEYLGVLAGGIAHDFNNLLMVILGRADMATLSLSPSSPVYQHLEEIMRASHRAADLCQQMLAYSGKGLYLVSNHDISKVVMEMKQMINAAVAVNAKVHYNISDNLPEVELDVTQIRQLIINLVKNASDSLGEIPGIISVATGIMNCDENLSENCFDHELSSGTYVYLEISDTGCGMDAETKSRIFDPFFSTKFTGRGLGLAAVLGIARSHKGAIKVDSEVGKGTTFKILLPVVNADEHKSNIMQKALPLENSGIILLVDDDPLVCEVSSEMLKKLGFRVLKANSGQECLDIFRKCENEITCVMLDLTMPEMTGEETFLELRRLRNDARVILASGYNEQDLRRRFADMGLAGFIQKPYSLAGLRDVLKHALNDH